MLSNGAAFKELRSALVANLARHPVLLSYIITDATSLESQLGLYIILRQITEMLDQCIKSDLVVDSLEDAAEITTKYPFRMPALLPGPLFAALLILVREMQSAAIITSFAHTVLDKTTHGMFHRDIDMALSGQPLELLFCHHALWPIPTPEIIIPPDRVHRGGEVAVFAAPSITRLRQQYPHLTASIVVQAALIIFIRSRTNHSQALFINIKAAHYEYPFAEYGDSFPPSSIKTHPDAVDVAGSSFNWALSLVAFRPDETVLDFST
ncbi:uncharacterized protein BO97DRAFT_428330 [Aspergillus homomorphus CBS 101889]|uniref:Uncharacterized protein n=1 Tax=Aspergillus homomorphus (strain CBS 101889) TaxID=1450537 RepID=A0A395HLN0_ASPHC|nr:hypothetical protein BO97DRAFT_428330 [Aspergillus homomorphus CBS 101889]RAL08506.1 hypothetical protein BO97DRAFT_428330 [Aspergillus homomorphus CBS 101889]